MSLHRRCNKVMLFILIHKYLLSHTHGLVIDLVNIIRVGVKVVIVEEETSQIHIGHWVKGQVRVEG